MTESRPKIGDTRPAPASTDDRPKIGDSRPAPASTEGRPKIGDSRPAPGGKRIGQIWRFKFRGLSIRGPKVRGLSIWGPKVRGFSIRRKRFRYGSKAPPPSRRAGPRGRESSGPACGAQGVRRTGGAGREDLGAPPGPPPQGPSRGPLHDAGPSPPGSHPDRSAGRPGTDRALRLPTGRRRGRDPRQHLSGPGSKRAARHGGRLRGHRHPQECGAVPRRCGVRPR